MFNHRHQLVGHSFSCLAGSTLCWNHEASVRNWYGMTFHQDGWSLRHKELGICVRWLIVKKHIKFGQYFKSAKKGVSSLATLGRFPMDTTAICSGARCFASWAAWAGWGQAAAVMANMQWYGPNRGRSLEVPNFRYLQGTGACCLGHLHDVEHI